MLTRRDLIVAAAGASATAAFCATRNSAAPAEISRRPAPAQRCFRSAAVEETITAVSRSLGNSELAWMFANCFPNTLDTAVFYETVNGRPDTFVITGDINAMWLRDSTAQVFPYLTLAARDRDLRRLLEGVIRRQTQCILRDSYANAFMRDPDSPPLPWAKGDRTLMRPGVAERKWEIDSLCYTLRLAWAYWQRTGDTAPFDAEWREAARRVIATFREQQRLDDDGPYRFQRDGKSPLDTLDRDGLGKRGAPTGMVHSCFRPSDDACSFPFFIPGNLFAVASLRQLSTLAHEAVHEESLANDAEMLARQIESGIRRYGVITHPIHGRIWAYEVDGFGGHSCLDDAGAPGLLNLPYLDCCDVGDPQYQRTRKFALSPENPYFVRGRSAEGIGSPHVGGAVIWPLSIIYRALTSRDEGEIRQCLRWLIATHAGTGFMHESFAADDPTKFTRPWFAWANTLFGELILTLQQQRPKLLIL